jgi:hypothetical protein
MAIGDVLYLFLSRHGAAQLAFRSDFWARWEVGPVNKQRPTDCLSLCALGLLMDLENAKVNNLFVDIIMDIYTDKNVDGSMNGLNTNEKNSGKIT